MSVVAVLCDSREPTWVQKLTFGASMASTVQLEYGDLWLTTEDGTMVIVERKQPDDFLGSIRDDRIWTQLAGCVRQSRWTYLVITGELQCGPGGKVVTDRGMTGWNWTAVQGALLRAQELGVFVAYAAGDGDYEACVVRLAGRSHDPSYVVPPVKAASILSDGEKVLTALPGIGLEKVKPLWEYASTTAFALQYLTTLSMEKTEHVAGIGAGIKRGVRRALGLRDDEELAVVIAETGQIKKETNGNE